jgi:hypothetical protein
MRRYRPRPRYGRDLVMFLFGAWFVLLLQCLL